MKKPVLLVIMDGFGISERSEGNAVTLANTPNIDLLRKEYPNSFLKAHGLNVGLPEGQMGNSEVGHLNLGAGRIVYQSLTRINKSIVDGDFFTNDAYVKAVKNAKENNKKLHILGLLSDGGVHSHIEHIKALLDLAKSNGLKDVYVHAFLDGRDVPPRSALQYVEDLENKMNEISVGKIGSVHGRYYAMDRDKNWDRVQQAYDVLTTGKGLKSSSASKGISDSYANDIDDEFVLPFIVEQDSIIEDNDSVIFANFRPDRAIEISTALTNPSVTEIDSTNGPKELVFVSTMLYSDNVKGELAYNLQILDNMFGDVVSEAGLNQLRIAETEKYAHVTFFFDGGMDKEIKGSTRALINSPKVATYDMQPEMSAYLVTDRIIDEIEKDVHDVIILNFANCDMVGHTGVISAAVKAVEVVDECLGRVVDAILDRDGVAIITADHGNAEKMVDENGEVFTAHTINKVPLIITKKDIEIRDDGVLADVAPTLLEFLKIEQPSEMTGKSLIKK